MSASDKLIAWIDKRNFAGPLLRLHGCYHAEDSGYSVTLSEPRIESPSYDVVMRRSVERLPGEHQQEETEIPYGFSMSWDANDGYEIPETIIIEDGKGHFEIEVQVLDHSYPHARPANYPTCMQSRGIVEGSLCSCHPYDSIEDEVADEFNHLLFTGVVAEDTSNDLADKVPWFQTQIRVTDEIIGNAPHALTLYHDSNERESCGLKFKEGDEVFLFASRINYMGEEWIISSFCQIPQYNESEYRAIIP